MITLRGITTALIIAVPFASAGLALGGHHDFLLKPPATGSRLADLDVQEGAYPSVASDAISTSAIQSELDAGIVRFAAARESAPAPVVRTQKSRSSATRKSRAPESRTGVEVARGRPALSSAAVRSSTEPLTHAVQATPSRWLDLDP